MYASRADLKERFGVSEVEQLERGLIVGQSVETALQDASDIADGYLAVRYSVPLSAPPANLKIYICDIARYLLWKSRASDEVRQRYEDAIAFLKLVAIGKARLQVIETDGQVKPATVNNARAAVGSTYRGGVFGDAVLGQMPDVR